MVNDDLQHGIDGQALRQWIAQIISLFSGSNFCKMQSIVWHFIKWQSLYMFLYIILSNVKQCFTQPILFACYYKPVTAAYSTQQCGTVEAVSAACTVQQVYQLKARQLKPYRVCGIYLANICLKLPVSFSFLCWQCFIIMPLSALNKEFKTVVIFLSWQ